MFNIFLPRSETRGDERFLLRLLRGLGPSWRASPFMRLIQVAAFVCFLVLFLWSSWPFHGDTPINPQIIPDKEFVPTESFLVLDPLVPLSAAIAARAFVWSLWVVAGVLLFSVFVPGGFCAYVCPLGTLIDLFDWALGRRITRLRVRHGHERGGWTALRYYLLIIVLVAAAGGVMIAGFLAALPTITRAMVFTVNPIQIALLRGWHNVPPIRLMQIASVVLLALALVAGLLRPRFWCAYVCPTGALVSLFSFFRITDRKVKQTCIDCGACKKACPFDAVLPDFSTRWDACTFCQICGGACPPAAITFSPRWKSDGLKAKDQPAAREVSRRGFILASAFGAVSIVALRTKSIPVVTKSQPLIRPPGAVPEEQFLNMCVRCGACTRVCPGSFLWPASIKDQGIKGMWTPHAVYTWAGCDENCNFCGHACPTGAIRALPIDERRCAVMGVAVVRKDICLPHAGIDHCDICYTECKSTGYNAISYVRVHAKSTTGSEPEEGLLAPEVDPVKCVGCGRCENRCHLAYVASSSRLRQSAIYVQTSPVQVAGGGKVVELGGELRLAPPQSYKNEMARRVEAQKNTKRVIDVAW